MLCRAYLCIALLAFTVVTVCAASFACAQGVQVSVADGIHVRAPFVSVDVFPGGGVSVRAPYAAVDVRGSLYAIPQQAATIETAVPTPQALAALDDESLWRALRNTSLRLNERLRRFDTGATWQRYLRLPDELVSGSAANVEDRRLAAIGLQARFAAVADDGRYRKIADLAAFRSIQALLTEIASRSSEADARGNVSAEELPPPSRPPATNDRSILVPPQ